MLCHHLRNYSPVDSNWSVASCAARNHLYVPSLGDLVRLCKTASHNKCPYFLSRKKDFRPTISPQYIGDVGKSPGF